MEDKISEQNRVNKSRGKKHANNTQGQLYMALIHRALGSSLRSLLNEEGSGRLQCDIHRGQSSMCSAWNQPIKGDYMANLPKKGKLAM